MLPPTGPARPRRRGRVRAVLLGVVVAASAVLVAVVIDRSTPAVFVPGPTSLPSAPAGARPSGSSFDPAHVAVSFAPIVNGLKAPLAIVNAGDGTNRLFVAQQGGEIRVIRDGRALPTPFLDIGAEITSGGERGLLGVAFHPDYPRDPRVFVDYTDSNGDTQVSSFVVSADDPDRLDPTAEARILHVKQPFANHNGGALLFDPSGMLLVSLGDGGSGGDPQGNGQSLTTLLGKILRIDIGGSSGGVPYRIPPDNPFASGAGGNRPEIWLTGLRNPWRISFDRATGDLWIGDVGQNDWEEIDVQRTGQPAGTNFGWNRMEGTHCFEPALDCDAAGLTAPVTDYGHDLGCTVIGGNVYRGSAQPDLVGGYVFGDYCSGRIWAIDPVGDGYRSPTLVADSGLSVSAFGEDEAGELYAADIGGGAILRVTATTR